MTSRGVRCTIPNCETMAEPDKDEQRKAFATTELGSGDGEVSARRLPTPVLVRDDDEDDGPDTMLGRVLGGLYKVEERIGEGGMGTVYAARHIHLNKRFAVKVLSPKIAQLKQAVERLHQEAVAASSIDHDNIVDVVSFDTTEDGEVFIVMELLQGKSLAELLEDGPVPLRRAVHIAYQMCRALHAAHERGIVHRDLKPENVFIVRKEQADFVKILDFGISKVKSAETEEVRMTKTGQLIGTPLYMSPEQAKGEQDVDRRADIYAFGVILYEMVTGTPPFEGGNYFQLLWKHGNEAPEPARSRNPDVPEALDAVLLKALSKAPEDRFQTMAELEAAIAAAVPDVGPPMPHFPSGPSLTPPRTERADVPPRRRFVGWVAAGGVVVALATIGVVGALSRGEEPAEPIRVAGPERGAARVPPLREEDSEAEPDTPPDLPAGAETPEEDVPRVPVEFASTPPGATVAVDGVEIGQTPLIAPLPEGEGPVEVTFSLAGHRDHTVRVIPVEGARVEGRLRPIRRGDGGGGSVPLPIKTEF